MAQQNMNAVFYATTYHPIQAGSIDGTDTAAHDNGVYRALVASSTGLYDATGDPKAEGDPFCILFVGRLAHHTTEKTLHEVMSNYGRVMHIRLVRHIVTGASRGYAFVEFEKENDMHNAYEVAQHQIIDGSPILVDYNRQQLMPGWIPRRLGGGLGGRKESGQLRFGGRDRPFRAPLRIIPTEQLKKLGIPLPPVGRYMTRFQLPTIPRRPRSSTEGSYHRQKSGYKRSHFHETLSLSEEERGLTEQGAGFSPRLSRRSVGPERGSSSQHEGWSRRRTEGDAEENLSDRIDRDHEDVILHKKRRRSEQENDEKSTKSGREDREGSRLRDPGREYAKEHRKKSPSEQVSAQTEHETSKMSRREDRESGQKRDRGHEYLQEHKKRSRSDQGDEKVDYNKVTRSGHEDRGSSRYHERSSSRSRHKQGDSGDYDTSSSVSGHKDKDGGHRHKTHRSKTSRESTAEGDRSPKHRSEQRRRSESKHRRSEA